MTDIYRPILDSTSPLGLGLEVAKYLRRNDRAEYVSGELLALDTDDYHLAAVFIEPS